MKKTLLWGVLFGVLCSQAQADAPPSAPATPITSPAVSDPMTKPQINSVALTTAVPAPVINCDYPIPALTKTIDSALIKTWSEKATIQAFSLNPNDLDNQLGKLHNCFTDQGWSGFNTAMQQSGNLEAIKTQKLHVSSQIDGKAEITEVKDNQWKVTLPLQVVYQNDKEKVTQLLTINLTVGRKIKGDLGITQIIATARTAQPAAPNASTINAAPTDSTSTPTTATPNGTPTTPINEEPTASTPTIATPSTDNNQPVEQNKPATSPGLP
jgi:hypothetical protein